jgi:hypothetical protein
VSEANPAISTANAAATSQQTASVASLSAITAAAASHIIQMDSDASDTPAHASHSVRMVSDDSDTPAPACSKVQMDSELSEANSPSIAAAATAAVSDDVRDAKRQRLTGGENGVAATIDGVAETIDGGTNNKNDDVQPVFKSKTTNTAAAAPLLSLTRSELVGTGDSQPYNDSESGPAAANDAAPPFKMRRLAPDNTTGAAGGGSRNDANVEAMEATEVSDVLLFCSEVSTFWVVVA